MSRTAASPNGGLAARTASGSGTPRRPEQRSRNSTLTRAEAKHLRGDVASEARLTPDRRETPDRKESAMSAVSGRSAVDSEARRTRREELRQFYGIKGEGSSQGARSPQKGEIETPVKKGKRKDGDPLDIDSPGFDANKYYENLISRSSLSELIKTASTLSADVGNLKSSRHALVYNHHHQLFAAGDTIAHLNSRTPQLLGIMTSLQDSFSEISRLVDAIALPEKEPASPKRKSWEIGVEKLRLMVLAEEPPDKLRECFETFREQLEKVAEGDEDSARVLKECQALTPTLHTEDVPAEGEIVSA